MAEYFCQEEDLGPHHLFRNIPGGQGANATSLGAEPPTARSARKNAPSGAQFASKTLVKQTAQGFPRLFLKLVL